MKKYPGQGIGFVQCAIQRTKPKEEGGESEYEIKLTDETVMERGGLFGTFREIIDHSPSSVDLARLESGRAAFLYEHDRKDQIGVLHSPRLEGRALYAKVRWASHQRAQEVRTMVDEGVRTNISAGMEHRKVKLVEESAEKGDLWRVMRWAPMEASSVAIGNNPNAAFTGYAEGAEQKYHVEVVVDDSPPIHGGSKAMNRKHVRTDQGGVIEVAEDDPRPALGEIDLERHRSSEINGMCRRYGYPDLADAFITNGLGVDAVAHELLKKVTTNGTPVRPGIAQSDPLAAVPKKERQMYSYAKALLEAADNKLSGRELEIHQELRAKQSALSVYSRVDRGSGIMLPLDLRTDEERLQQYTLTSTAATKGAEVVFDRPGEVIELLRNQSAVVRLGARLLTGLTSPIAFPKQTGAMTAQWVGEAPATAVSASDLALGLVTLTPRWLQATTSISRQLLLQASVDVEAMVREDIAQIHALAIDLAALHGIGSGGQPKGIYKWPDVQTKAMGGAVAYAELTEMIGKVADKNALMGSPGWLTTPLMAAKWLGTPEHDTAAMGNWIWQGRIDTLGGGGRVAGYPAYSSSQVSKTMSTLEPTGGSDHGIAFGNWNDEIVGLFGSQEVIVDPFTLADKGLLKITSFQGADCITRHGESFCVSTGATTG